MELPIYHLSMSTDYRAFNEAIQENCRQGAGYNFPGSRLGNRLERFYYVMKGGDCGFEEGKVEGKGRDQWVDYVNMKLIGIVGGPVVTPGMLQTKLTHSQYPHAIPSRLYLKYAERKMTFKFT